MKGNLAHGRTLDMAALRDASLSACLHVKKHFLEFLSLIGVVLMQRAVITSRKSQ